MSGLIAKLIGFGVPAKLARPILIAGLFIAILGALGIGKCAYDKAVISRHEAKQEAQQAKRERKADTGLREQEKRDNAASEQRKQEIDDATRDIPDQAPSARQRAIVCVELRRQAKAHGRPEPAC